MKVNKKNPFEQIRPDGKGKKSYQWYQGQIRKLGLNTLTPNKALDSGIGKLVSNVMVGKMFLFMYNPKMRDTLPYYDEFPLVLPFNVVKGGFLGLNLHYLPPLLRMNLLNNLMKLADTPRISKNTQLRMSWNIIGNYSRFPEVKPCVKTYLYPHVQSRFLEINPHDWRAAIFLPLESFQKESKSTVHKLSKDIIDA
jgi:hypothetical protein